MNNRLARHGKEAHRGKAAAWRFPRASSKSREANPNFRAGGSYTIPTASLASTLARATAAGTLIPAFRAFRPGESIPELRGARGRALA